jgi:diguanylate cyclase (GGDEF)-like protein
VATIFAGRLARPKEQRRLGQGAARLAVVIVAYTAALAFAAYAFARGNQLVGFTVASTISALLLLRLLVNAVDRHRHSAQLEQALHEQEQLAVMDSLTGLYNRRFLDAELQLELDRGARSQQPVGILLCDLDHFKQVNDRYGHLVGDSVLREVARRLLGAVRNGDLVARYGGEEFVVLLPGGGKEQLKEIGERCRRAFDETPFFLPKGHKTTVTISIGGACWPKDAGSAHHLFEVADRALYRAKGQGRNRVYMSEQESRHEASAFVAEAKTESVDDVTTPALATEATALPNAPADNNEKMERWAELVARALGLDEQAQRRCALATRFHDVGKSALPESILVKHGPLSVAEWELVCEHPERGAKLVELAPGLASVGSIIREHHERFDGRGYPFGKSHDEISPEARIVACCDAWSAMRSNRPYAPAKTASEARAELLAGRGTQFDPNVVMAFLMFDEADLDGAEGTLTTSL